MAFFSHPTPEFLKLVKIMDLNRENDKPKNVALVMDPWVVHANF